MADPSLHLGEPADEADWRALVEQGLKGAQWERLVGKTSDGIAIEPLYREPDMHTATDVSGFPGAAPFVRGAGQGAWLIRQTYAHPDPARTNRDILADLAGGVGAVELVIDPTGENGVAIRGASDFDLALADVMLEAAPVSLDAGAHGAWASNLLRDKLKGVAAPGTAFNLDPRDGAALSFTAQNVTELPAARFLRVDARPTHEAGGTEAQEIASALDAGIAALRGLAGKGVAIERSARTLSFAVGVGPDVLIEAAKLRALRLCWARVLEASGAAPEKRAAHIHGFTSRRMMTRYDAWTNILRVTTSAFAAAIGGADEITTYPFTDALGLPAAFARRVARNTQHVLLEECRLGHVADPAGGAWFVEKLTRDLAERAWSIMQEMQAGRYDLSANVGKARSVRERAIATRRETITGVTDFPLLGAPRPEIDPLHRQRLGAGKDAGSPCLAPIRWAEPFETLRDRAEARALRPIVFYATLGALAAFGSRAQFARNLFAAGGVGAVGEETAHTSRDAMIDAFGESGTRVAVICGTDGAYTEDAQNAAQRLKAAGAHWVVLAGKPAEREATLRAAGVDQFVFAGQDALNDLETLHAALGLA